MGLTEDVVGIVVHGVRVASGPWVVHLNVATHPTTEFTLPENILGCFHEAMVCIVQHEPPLICACNSRDWLAFMAPLMRARR
jgi:hypothetical protein